MQDSIVLDLITSFLFTFQNALIKNMDQGITKWKMEKMDSYSKTEQVQPNWILLYYLPDEFLQGVLPNVKASVIWLHGQLDIFNSQRKNNHGLSTTFSRSSPSLRIVSII